MNLFITNCENNQAYPVAIVVDSQWQISPMFDQDEFSEWLQDQDGVDLEMVLAEKTIQQFTSSCPECGDPIILLPDESQKDREVMNFECTNCGNSSSIEIVEPEDD